MQTALSPWQPGRRFAALWVGTFALLSSLWCVTSAHKLPSLWHGLPTVPPDPTEGLPFSRRRETFGRVRG